jgi:hypothetical protein
MLLEKRNAAPAGTGNRVECQTGKVNAAEDSPLRPAIQELVVARIARRFGLTLPTARVVADLAGLGVSE